MEYLGTFDNTTVYKVDLSADRDIILHSNGNNRTITGLKSGLNILRINGAPQTTCIQTCIELLHFDIFFGSL